MGKVLILLLRALRDGVSSALESVADQLPSPCKCCLLNVLAGKLEEVRRQSYDVLVNVVEEYVQESLQAYCVPKAITDKIEWSEINPDAHVGVPKSKNPEFQKRKLDFENGTRC